MADLSAVLRKTIDGLPGANPQLRAKVYEKARAAINRQIAVANPPLPDEVAAARLRALEDAIAQTEADYLALEGHSPDEAEPDIDNDRAPDEAEVAAAAQTPLTPAAPVMPVSLEPAASAEEHQAAEVYEDANIPAADMQGPRYPAPRRSEAKSGSKAPLIVGLVVLGLIGAGAAAYYSGAFAPALPIDGQQAAVEPEEGAGEVTTPPEPATDGTATGEAAEGTETPAVQEPGAREYTQRLLPDGTETDAGPGTSTANVFDEGTDVSAAAPAAPVTSPDPVAPGVTPDAGTEAVLPEGTQSVVFYEERFNSVPGSQHGGNVRWSIVNEPPADGQDPEPAIRGVVDVPDKNMQMTLTIRRNADTTLPASHVIEMLFTVPDNFTGGEIANVQRLALKPNEQDRGRPLIGVAGKISDGFFWVALNNLQQVVDDNLNLMANEQWIDIPLAYESGQRALMSLEKGPEGDAVFKQALDDWRGRS
ncbi:hypothetical protein FPY71_11840 [Aureimonas fodinaquatilis]|uniref:Uncharacterized protein n=1 Tax=Aureimonas fodinaquatilis TaxID=2565783 RepID=A0A5B0DX99_9HYPH|nr:hypothetical protein [Aureimonas fodinaquatilis]KAA0971126.1 hypothetical protein FPY71_11840 [Aureimonas fodinaquatilis]